MCLETAGLKANRANPDWTSHSVVSDPDLLAAVAQLDVRPTGDQEVAIRPLLDQQHSFLEI